MDINELRKISEDNKSKAKTFSKDSYVRFIKGKMKSRAEKGYTEVTNVWENLNIPMPTKELLGEIIGAFQSEGFRVTFNDYNNSITKISW